MIIIRPFMPIGPILPQLPGIWENIGLEYYSKGVILKDSTSGL